MESKGRIKKINLLKESPFLNLYQLKYENKLGKVKSWTMASRKSQATLEGQHFHNEIEKNDAVVIFAIHEEAESLVILKQFRVPINDYIYELPAGLIDGDEEIESALRRELFEETGLTVVDFIGEKRIPSVYASPGMTDESLAIAFVTCKGRTSKEFLEEDEDIEAMVLNQDEARELLRNNPKIDVKAYFALELFAHLGLKILKTF